MLAVIGDSSSLTHWLSAIKPLLLLRLEVSSNTNMGNLGTLEVCNQEVWQRRVVRPLRKNRNLANMRYWADHGCLNIDHNQQGGPHGWSKQNISRSRWICRVLIRFSDVRVACSVSKTGVSLIKWYGLVDFQKFHWWLRSPFGTASPFEVPNMGLN